MPDVYYADVYLRGCGELIKTRQIVEDDVDEDGNELVKITVWAYKPGE